MSLRQWLLMLALSVLWGGSFFFVGVLVGELPALTIVLSRVGLAALFLVPFVLAFGHRLPRTAAEWRPFLVMSLLNNVIPFSAIVLGQKEIASGLASVLNAATPLFAVVLTHLLTDDRMRWRSIVGVLVGIAGVAILVGPALAMGDRASALGMALVLAGACSYGFAGVWGRRLRSTPPLLSACCQLICSTVVMGALAAIVDRPWQLPLPSPEALLALVGLAALSTALSYVIFFRILAVSGAANVMLVTLLIPVSGLTLGAIVLGEIILPRHILGAVVIASGLLAIDGRIFGLAAARVAINPR